MRDSPAWKPNLAPVVPKLAAAAKLPLTWQMSFLYAVAFGGFVAFSTYLPTYLKNVYEFGLTGAGTRTAGFAIAAVIARPIGGILADKIGPRIVVAISLGGAAVMSLIIALRLPPEIPAGTSFVVMALFLGLGTGGVFAWVAELAPAERVGAITGIVGACGGLGGFFPPLVHGCHLQRGSAQLHHRIGAVDDHRRRRAALHPVRDSAQGSCHQLALDAARATFALFTRTWHDLQMRRSPRR